MNAHQRFLKEISKQSQCYKMHTVHEETPHFCWPFVKGEIARQVPSLEVDLRFIYHRRLSDKWDSQNLLEQNVLCSVSFMN